MVDTEIILIKPAARVQDATGVWRTTAEEKSDPIPAIQDDSSRSEFFAAGQVGLRAEFRFIVNVVEYNGEDMLEWEGKRYAIYRHYHVPGTDDMELYAQRDVGVQRGQ